MSPQIFRVIQHADGAWGVDHDGKQSNRTRDKAEAIASATKLARESIFGGRPAQVRVDGETGYF
jgi:hypothetical protein